MVIPPLNISDIILLLVIGSLTLLITVQLISPHSGQTNLTINKKKIKNAAYSVGILSLIAFATRIIITGS